MSLKVLIFGSGGQLGQECVKRMRDLHWELRLPRASELDITDAESVTRLIQQLSPDVVLNAAAYTAVDKAEIESKVAFAVNAEAPRVIAKVCKEVGCRMVHISTDYVFGPGYAAPIEEGAACEPCNVYGSSKRAGEVAVLDQLGDMALVVRTASLHGAYGENFVRTMVRLMEEKNELSVVADQYMSPTWAGYLAEIINDLIRLKSSGVVHGVCDGAVTWFEFCQEIQAQGREVLGKKLSARLQQTTAAAFGRPAKRASYSVLSCAKLEKLIGRKVMSWRDGLHNHLSQLTENGR